jgi:DNA-binding MarR family transcriptional regulator
MVLKCSNALAIALPLFTQYYNLFDILLQHNKKYLDKLYFIKYNIVKDKFPQRGMSMSDVYIDEALKLDNQLCFPLYAAARQVVSLYTPYLKELGLTYTQYIVFLVLWEGEAVTVGELCRRLYLDNGTLTPLLKKLEAAGYIVRERGSEDERVVTVSLTDDGRAMKERAAHIPFKVGSCIALSGEEADTMYRLLYKLLRGE